MTRFIGGAEISFYQQNAICFLYTIISTSLVLVDNDMNEKRGFGSIDQEGI